MNRRFTRTAIRAVPPVLLAAALGACDDVSPSNDQNVWNARGEQAKDILSLYKVVTGAAVIVGIAVGVVVVYVMVRFRRRSDADNPKQSHGNPIVEGSAVIGSFILLVAIGIPSVALIWKLDSAPAKSARPLEVNVVAKQWWWQYAYPSPDGAKDANGKPLPVVTSTELHIPINRPIWLKLDGRPNDDDKTQKEVGTNPLAGSTPDVIHSFWIPELNGKRDIVPGRVNTWTITATKPGKYLGQCAQYCGLSHANMRMRVIAMTESDFDNWVAQQRRGPAEPFTEADGKTVLKDGAPGLITKFQCGNCHVFGDSSKPNYGPNLTHLGSRSTIAGGTHAVFDQDQNGLPTGSYKLDVLAHWIWDAPDNTVGTPMESRGCRWPIPVPEDLDPAPPCQGMPSFKNVDYVPTSNGTYLVSKYPLMTFDEACTIAEYLAAGRPEGMPVDQGQCENSEAVK